MDENGEIWELCGAERPVLRTSARTAIIDSHSGAFKAEISRYESRLNFVDQRFIPLKQLHVAKALRSPQMRQLPEDIMTTCSVSM